MGKFISVTIKPKPIQGMANNTHTFDLSQDAILLFRKSSPGLFSITLKPEYENRVKQALGIDLRTEIESITIPESESKKLLE